MVSIDASVSIDAISALDVDTVFVPIFDGEETRVAEIVGGGDGLSRELGAALAQGAISTKSFALSDFYAPDGLTTRRLVLVGAGKEDDLDAEALRRLSGAALRHVLRNDVDRIAFVARGGVPSANAARAIVEGAILGAFEPGIHKSDKSGESGNNGKTPPRSLLVAGVESSDAVRSAIERGQIMATATNLARSLIVEPANYLTPAILAAHAQAIAREGDLEVTIFDEAEVQERGMGGVIAVGKGSANPPRFIDLRYRPSTPSNITLAIVGKGVCFDTGGISLKGNTGMYRMKGDMAGGAAVLGAMRIVSKLAPNINVMGIVPAVENAPGPTAQKPGDVFVGMSGKTVEVMSTDAEGRLILSDGISYAVAEGATHIVDIATLTGTVRRALGDRHVGAFASDDALFEKLTQASRMSGESFWRLPIDDEYARGIRGSLVADLNETGGDAGASIGAKFIQQFTDGVPWIHLDIAGLSWPAHTPAYRAPGPTGVTVRTLAELALLLGQS
jgi:leucyl aminopeptidase